MMVGYVRIRSALSTDKTHSTRDVDGDRVEVLVMVHLAISDDGFWSTTARANFINGFCTIPD